MSGCPSNYGTTGRTYDSEAAALGDVRNYPTLAGKQVHARQCRKCDGYHLHRGAAPQKAKYR